MKLEIGAMCLFIFLRSNAALADADDTKWIAPCNKDN